MRIKTNFMNITINIVELASELADADLMLHYGYNMYKDEDDCISYTEEGQDIFNQLYDKYYAIIENCNVQIDAH